MRVQTLVSMISLGSVAVVAACSSSPDSTPTADAGVPTADAGADGPTCLDKSPASGFSNVSSGDGKLGTYGENTAMVLDEKGDPVIAFVHHSPSGASGGDDSLLYVTRWDRCTASFTAPVVVDTVGGVGDSSGTREVAIARDASTGSYALAFQHIGPPPPGMANKTSEVWVAQSTDGGKTWAKSQLSEHDQAAEGDAHPAGTPGIAMAGGKIFVAYNQISVPCDATDASKGRCDGWYAEGAPGSWTRKRLPKLDGGFGLTAGEPVNVAVDSAGKPAIAYLESPETAYNTQVAFWRPGDPTAVKVGDSGGKQNDSPSLSLAFDGLKPRIVAQLVVPSTGDNELLYFASDNGSTWFAPVTLPHDKGDGTGFWQSLAIDGKGNLAVSATANTGTGDGVCGAPKLSRSADGAAWTTCGEDTTKTHGATSGRFVTSAFAPDGKLVVAFELTNNQADTLGTGVALWREP